VRYLAALLIFSLIGAIPRATAQQDPLDATAAEVAAAIAKAAGKHNSDAQVLVADFSETKGHPTALGPDLARQFSLSLQAHAKNFILSDRDKLLRQLAADKLSAESFANPNTLKCYSPAQAAEFAVTGEMNDMPDAVVIAIKTFRIKGGKVIFEKQVTVQITPSMQELLAQGFETTGSRGSSPSQADSSARNRVPVGGSNGYSSPFCIYCPSASFSPAAIAAKVQGQITLNVQVSAEGRALDISLLRGLPCGLNDEAIETVRRWKFRPATGPDGQPADVTVTVQVSFRLY
jgi:TonB family protein